jgi:hypothetical protein
MTLVERLKTSPAGTSDEAIGIDAIRDAETNKSAGARYRSQDRKTR